MVRMAASVVFGFVLMYLQSLLVMKWNHYSSIQFQEMSHIFLIWGINFFCVFIMLTQLKNWLSQKLPYVDYSKQKADHSQ